MKTTLFLISLLIFFAGKALAQGTTYPTGGYKNLKELNSGKPSGFEAFHIFRRTSENLEDYGGNDYNIVLKSDSNSLKKVWRRYFAIASGDTLYLNCKKLDIGVGFTPVLVTGKILAFKAYMPYANNGAGQEIADAMIVGSLGAAANSGGSGRNKNQFPFLWSLDTQTGQKNMLTYAGMLHTLEAFPDLKKQFCEDEEKDREEVMLAYIRKANSR